MRDDVTTTSNLMYNVKNKLFNFLGALETGPLELIKTLVDMMGEKEVWLRWPTLTSNGLKNVS